MSVLGLRVGPFEIVETARIPEPGNWYYARRTGHTRRHPQEVLVRLLGPEPPQSERAALQRQFDILRGMEDTRVPTAVALYEGMGALAIHAIRGTPLTEIMRGRTHDEIEMTPATLLDIGLEIAETLQHMHHTGTVHGHLSVENVLLGSDGKVWICGLGQGPETPPPAAWMPPERARGQPASQATDQWSLAAICGALIVGSEPWSPGDDPAAGRATPTALIEPVMAQWPALGRLLQKLLDDEPANRHASMHPVRQELLALSRKAGGTSSRRELGAILSHRRADEAEAAETLEDRGLDDAPVEAVFETLEPPADSPPEAEVPADPPSDADLPVAAVTASADAPSVEWGPRAQLPSEEIPVVRPQVQGDVPTAQLGEQVAADKGSATLFESSTGNTMNHPGPDDPRSGSDETEGSPHTKRVETPAPPAPPPMALKPPAPPRSLDLEDEEEDEEAATVLYGRDAIDKLLNATPSSAARAAESPAPAPATPPSSPAPVPSLDEPVSRPTAIPSTDSRDPSEEVHVEDNHQMENAVPLPIEQSEPALGSGRVPLANMDMPSGPALGNPEEIVPPVELPKRNLMAQRIATGVVVLMGLAMAAYSIWQFL